MPTLCAQALQQTTASTTPIISMSELKNTTSGEHGHKHITIEVQTSRTIAECVSEQCSWMFNPGQPLPSGGMGKEGESRHFLKF